MLPGYKEGGFTSAHWISLLGGLGALIFSTDAKDDAKRAADLEQVGAYSKQRRRTCRRTPWSMRDEFVELGQNPPKREGRASYLIRG